jgi:type IV secretory pathway VirB4 component
MRLIGTLVYFGTAFAIYSQNPITNKQLRKICSELYSQEWALFPSDIKVIPIGEEIPPDILPNDFSSSLHDR